MFRLTCGQPALLLAPMQGVTDAPMRRLLSELGVLTACVAEYVRISAHVPPPHVFHQLVPELQHGARTAHDTAVIVQLLGGDAERMAASAHQAATLGAEAIDLNFGCPANTVNRHDGGATLLKEPERLYRIVRAVRDATPQHIPVSAKLRLGWEDPADILETSDAAARGGAAWLTIHGRTRVQGYKPYALWEPIAEVRERLAIPIVANGDLFTLDKLKRCREITGAEHYMLGRGAIANPHALLEMAAYLRLGRGTQRLHTPAEAQALRRQLMQRYIAIVREQAPEHAERFLPGRLKQWSLLVREHGDEDIYSDIKRLKAVGEIEDVLFAGEASCA